jgi:hypothetical protein
VAGILGPVVVNYIREAQLASGVAPSQAYNSTLYILATFLAGGLLCNFLVRPVAADRFMGDAELARERALAHESAPQAQPAAAAATRLTPAWLVACAWIAVAIPLGWGIWRTLLKSLALFS